MRIQISLVGVALLAFACSSDNRPPPVAQNQAPSIVPVMDQNVEANQSLGPVSVTIADDQTALDLLQLAVLSDNADLVPEAAIVIDGTGATRQLVITPTAALTGSAQITLTVTDGSGASATTAFELTVVPEMVSYAQFLRSVFSDDQNALPQDVNSRVFIQDAADDEFADLF